MWGLDTRLETWLNFAWEMGFQPAHQAAKVRSKMSSSFDACAIIEWFFRGKRKKSNTSSQNTMPGSTFIIDGFGRVVGACVRKHPLSVCNKHLKSHIILLWLHSPWHCFQICMIPEESQSQYQRGKKASNKLLKGQKQQDNIHGLHVIC